MKFDADSVANKGTVTGILFGVFFVMDESCVVQGLSVPG